MSWITAPGDAAGLGADRGEMGGRRGEAWDFVDRLTIGPVRRASPTGAGPERATLHWG